MAADALLDYGAGLHDIEVRIDSASPTLPFRFGLRHLIAWMNDHPAFGHSVILDNFSAEAREVVRYAHLTPDTVFTVPKLADLADLETIARFVVYKHPRLLIYAPRGNLGRFEGLADNNDVSIETTRVTLRLHRLWSAGEGDYRIYEIEPTFIGPRRRESMERQRSVPCFPLLLR
jgi:hypothetical protein